MSSAPSAQQFLRAEGRDVTKMDHDQYMDFTERYGDFIVEFEKKGGDLRLVETWPRNKITRIIR